MTVEQESQACIEPRPAKKLEISKSRFKIERGKHAEGFVEFFDSSAVVEKEQAVNEGALAPSHQNVVGAKFGLNEAMRWRRENSRRSDTVVGHAVKDDVFPWPQREEVDGVEDLIGDAVEFEGGVEGDDGVLA